jgi:hypothetical protein
MDRIANATTKPEVHEEIEITTAMIDAGVLEFLAFRCELNGFPEEAVSEIFKAMVLASRAPS